MEQHNGTITIDESSLTSTSFRIHWDRPIQKQNFNHYYDLSLTTDEWIFTAGPKINETSWKFKKLTPGKIYHIVLKTITKNGLTMFELTKNITLKPLPVLNLQIKNIKNMEIFELSWTPDDLSFQDSFNLQIKDNSQAIKDSFVSTNEIFEVNKTKVILNELLPGRNLTIIIQAVSNNIKSIESIVYQTTRPLPPVSYCKIIGKTISISWRHDIKSKQEKYEVMYTRKDTNETFKNSTNKSEIIIENYYPGAHYDIESYAMNYKLKSQSVYCSLITPPNPPINFKIKKIIPDLSILLEWNKPKKSIFTDYELSFKEDDSDWIIMTRIPSNESQFLLTAGMRPGFQYIYRLTSISGNVESIYPSEILWTLQPSPVSGWDYASSANTIKLLIYRPIGRIEYYVINVTDNDIATFKIRKILMSKVENSNKKQSIITEEISFTGLKPNVKYIFEIYSVSYGIKSSVKTMLIRTNYE